MLIRFYERSAIAAGRQAGQRQVIPRVKHLYNHSRFGQNERVRTKAAGFWDRVFGTFKKDSEDVLARNKLREASRELLQMLCATEAPDLLRIDELLDAIAEGQPFMETSLGGGPWVVRYTRGKPFLWNITYNTGRLLNGRNRAAQEFDPATRSAVNLLEINGPNNRIEAYGTYEPVDDSPMTPKTIRAKINSGRLFLGTWELQLSIFGTGYFDVMYVDESLRVFRSNGRFAVQVRADLLQD